MDSPESVSVVVPTYRRAQFLPDAIFPLLADPATSEVVVVVDGCDDGSMETLQAIAQEDARVRPVWRANGGEAAARVTGLHEARGDLVLFLDDDVVAAPGLVSGHRRLQSGRERTVVVGYMPLDLAATRRPGEVIKRLYSMDYERVCGYYEADADQILLNLWAGNFSLRRADALEVGFEGAEGLVYHADKVIGYKLFRSGFSGMFSRELRATHRYERTLDQLRRDIGNQAQARIWIKEHGGLAPDDPWMRHARPDPALNRQERLEASPPGLALIRATAELGFWTSRLTGRLRLWSVETAAARLFRRYEMKRLRTIHRF
jgi:glycosyltransferase involved in cell wall biosynthesis